MTNKQHPKVSSCYWIRLHTFCSASEKCHIICCIEGAISIRVIWRMRILSRIWTPCANVDMFHQPPSTIYIYGIEFLCWAHYVFNVCPDDCVYDTDKLYLINNSVFFKC